MCKRCWESSRVMLTYAYNPSTQETKARWPTVLVSLGITLRPCFKNKNKEVAKEILQGDFLVLECVLPNESPAECLPHREIDPHQDSPSGRFHTAPTKVLDWTS